MSHLRHQMIRAMELKDFSPRTHQSYLAAVEGLAKFHKKPPDRLTQTDVDDYLLHLKETGKSPSTRNVVISGLRFFYHHMLRRKKCNAIFPVT
ncbi:site-specific integrase [Desulfosarcina variabilis]|uniref:site-specific integrase n=1 Tax=Desulfosarcina variabilis TaxID=2300 RepID=UPI003AFAE458